MQKKPTHSHPKMENLDHRVSNYKKKSRKINSVKLNRKMGGLAWSSNEPLHRRTWKKGLRVIEWCNTMYHFEYPSKNKRLVEHRFDYDYVRNLIRFLICNFWFLFLTCRPDLQYGYIFLPKKWCEVTFCPSTPSSMRWLYLKVHMLPMKEKCKCIFGC
jgi:hypothetical protein